MLLPFIRKLINKQTKAHYYEHPLPKAMCLLPLRGT